MKRKNFEGDWLLLLDPTGPFLSLPVIKKAFPHGMDVHDPAGFERLRFAHDEWQEQNENPEIHREWIRFILRESLGYPEEVILRGQAIPQTLSAEVAEHREILRPDLVIVNPSGRAGAGKARLLIQQYEPDVDLTKPVRSKLWKESPAGRMALLLRGADVRLGIVTNGDHWMLINAKRGENPGAASWYSWLWLEERDTLRAFRTLLGAGRLFGVADAETLEALLEESIQNQQEVTDLLGLQTRRAVEILVQSVDSSDRDYKGELLRGVPENEVYEAAVTFMMRLVFLFCAEEKGLLPLDNEQYQTNYAASVLRDYLRETADHHGEEVLERRIDAWQRLLATFRAVHAGTDHEDLHLPPYGGHLFDPDRYPFLEGRARGTTWRTTPARPLPIHNRTVLHVLESLQTLTQKTGEAQKLSFRSLDIEQIGHVYEGLLDHTVKRATDAVVSLVGKQSDEPEIEVRKLEEAFHQGKDALVGFLEELTKRPEKTIRKLLEAEVLPEESDKFDRACERDRKLLDRVLPFAAFVRKDTYGDPVVIPSGSLYVTEGNSRRSSATYYTPRSLTESIVKHTLDPLVYEGPAQGVAPEEWKLKTAREILSLKICDMACGSAAFLVQACRYLSERLVEAWDEAEAAHPGRIVITPEGDLSDAKPSDCIIPKDTEERLMLARRLGTDRCLYGVDRNPIAVEMAKLSLWLITLQRDRPFTFVDHAIKCGDSLLGASSLDQLRYFHPEPDSGEQQLHIVSQSLQEAVEKASVIRERLESLPVLDIKDAEQKSEMLEEANKATETVRLAANALMGACLAGCKGQALEGSLKEMAAAVNDFLVDPNTGASKLRVSAQGLLDTDLPEGDAHRSPFHWPLEFPEVFTRSEDRSGFDALVGNPPFKGGQKITGDLGTQYRNYLVQHLADGQAGSADLCSYFFLRAVHLLRPGGTFGLLATNTIAQGDTREVGLEQLMENGGSIYRAVQSRKWPGGANLEVAHVWLFRGGWRGKFVLEDQQVQSIGPFLSIPGKVQGKPYCLAANVGKSFIGSYVLGMGFIMEPDVAQRLIDKNPRNKEVLFPYLIGEDLNSRPDQSASRWVINFFDWPLDRTASGSWLRASGQEHKRWLSAGVVPHDYPGKVASDYPDCLAIVEQKVKPERLRLKDNSDGKRRKRLWWRYGREAPALADSIAGMDRVLVLCLVTQYTGFALVDTNQVFAHRLVVFPCADLAFFGLLQSTVHELWARKYSSQLETRLNYSPSDCMETYPFPIEVQSIREIAESYYAHRSSTMKDEVLGLTDLYTRFNRRSNNERAVTKLRDLHSELDKVVLRAFGWGDITVDHDFRPTSVGVRFSLSDRARTEILDRLLELNHRRYAEEVAAGMHDKKKNAKKDTDSKEQIELMGS